MQLIDVKTVGNKHILYVQEGCDLRLITIDMLNITYGSGGYCTVVGSGRYAIEPPLSLDPVRQDARTRTIRSGIFGRR